MLCQFWFKNFKSYRDEAVLDMKAANIEEFSDSLLLPPGDNFSPILPLAVIYGPNAGGKSNAISALAYLISRVCIPIIRSTGAINPLGMVLKSYSPFLFNNDSKNEPTEFEVVFHTEHAQYQYSLSVLNNSIIQESLHHIKTPCSRRRSVLLFKRVSDSIELGTALKKANKEKVNPTIPYLSFLAINYNISEINEAVKWFQSCCIVNYAVANIDHSYPEMLEDPKVKQTFLTLLAAMNIPISDYKIKDESGPEEEREFTIITTHTINGVQYNLELQHESEGTMKILSALPGILYSLLSGGLILFDELDAKLHPNLLRFIIDMYSDPSINQKHAQLIFTCHDVSIMKNDYLRRDEIWFAALNEDSASELWSLFDIQDTNGNHVKRTAAYDRQYLSGRYGADPYLKRILEWGDINGSKT